MQSDISLTLGSYGLEIANFFILRETFCSLIKRNKGLELLE